jgi:hypothetical protein
VKYEQIKDRKSEEFQRLTGLKPAVFAQMLSALREQIRVFGRPCKLSLEDQLLLTLMYWREYRSLLHIALAYDVSEPTVHRTIRKIEAALLACGRFDLPGKKALCGPELEWQVIVVDATETPVERPQKNKGGITVAKRSDTRAKHR